MSDLVTTDVPLDTLAAEIKARIEAGDRAADKAADHFRAAGLRLLDAKKRVAAEKTSFNDFLSEHGIGRSRAYELIGIAKGTKTLAGIRAATAERVARHSKRHRAAESVSNGRQEVDFAESEFERLQAEMSRLRFVFGVLMEEVENYFHSEPPSKHMEEHHPLIVMILREADKRLNEEFTLDETGAILDENADHIRPSRGMMVDELCDRYMTGDDVSDSAPYQDVGNDDGEYIRYRNRSLTDRIRISVAAGFKDAARDHLDRPRMAEPIHELTNVDIMAMAELFGRRIAEHRIEQSATA